MKTDQSSALRFKTSVITINDWLILQVPRNISDHLPSRGQVMVRITINNSSFETPLEPDGKWGHWLQLDKTMVRLIQIKSGDSVTIKLTPIKDWSEPVIPNDLRTALKKHDAANELWQSVTPLAHWEWVRWIRSTSNNETRQKRIDVAISKLTAGKRRPCCWNRNLSTEPHVSKSGVLLEPTS